MRDVDIDQLITFAKAYRSLGDAVGSQIDDLISGDHEGVNRNAIKLAHDRIYGMNEELDEILLDYLNDND